MSLPAARHLNYWSLTLRARPADCHVVNAACRSVSSGIAFDGCGGGCDHRDGGSIRPIRAPINQFCACSPGEPVQALTHVLVGAVDEAARYTAQADDGSAARADVDLALRRLPLALT